MTEQRATTVRWLDDREQAAWRAFLDMHARLTARLNREMQDASGLSLADYSVLIQLTEHVDARMRVLELARALRWEKSRLSHQLTRMQQRGLVDRSNCSEDRRGAFVVLTDQGRAAAGAVAPTHVDGVRRYLFDGLSPAEVDVLADVARQTLARLDEACAGRGDECGETGESAP